MNSIVIGFEVESKKPVKINLDDIIEDRALITANSRGGKSYIVRKFLEESNGKVQQIIIDPEGEYKTLREKYDYLLVGSKSEGAEIQISLKIADLLPIKLLELGVSAIIDLYELKPYERIRFVKLFLEGMINVKKELWHSCMIVIDEAHVFAPEKGSKTGTTESLDAVKDLASRGGKRGFALIACTQRLAKLSKDVTTELNNKFIGRAGDYDDQVRAVKELGLKSSDISLFGDLKHEFFVRGNAISDKVIRIKAYEVSTTHKSGGKQLRVVIPTPEKIKSIAASLKDIPEEAEKETKTKEDLQRQNSELRREIIVLKQNKPIQDPRALEISYDKGFKESERFWKNQLQYKQNDITKLLKIIEQIKLLSNNIPELTKVDSVKIQNIVSERIITNSVLKEAVSSVKIDNNRELVTISEDSPKLRDGAMKMLKTVAMYHPKAVTKNQVATISGFSVGGGTFNTYLSELKKLGWLNYSGEEIIITEDGLNNVGNVEPLSMDSEQLLNMWSSKFRSGASKMLREIASKYPNSITKEDLAESTGFSHGGGSFNTYISELRRNNLIEVSGGEIKASKELFPQEMYV